MQTPLVSIIIPTYNRAHLIGETLDSVLAQTYTNWECIVVDDGSTDSTAKLLKDYCKKDNRFQYHNRPNDRPKGANACRNYGFELSEGEYVNWFDSDDLMMSDCIELKILKVKNYDFVVSYSLDFNEKKVIGKIYEFDLHIPITAENFITQVIGWITNDVLLRKQSIVTIKFNEALKSGQEYNFFSRYLFETNNGIFINKCLSKRRVHQNSIQQKLIKNKIVKNKQLINNEIILLLDLNSKASTKIINMSLNRLVRFSYSLQKPFRISKYQIQTLINLVKYTRLKASIYYLAWIISNYIFGKGYIFIKKIYK